MPEKPEHRETLEETGRGPGHQEPAASAGPPESPPPSPPPPRGPSLKLILGGLLVAAAAFWAGTAWGTRVSPILAKLLEALSPAAEEPEKKDADGEDRRAYYTCGMHPWVILPRPGLCPICHMDLTPLDPAKFTGEIAIDPRVVQSMGVRVETIATGPLVRTIRTVGSVDYDETRVRDINIKVRGWIEELHVDYLGAEVAEGDPLFEIYSPELYDTQQQYLLAYRNRNQREIPFLAGADRDPEHLLESSRVRLEYYDITPDQIAALEKTGKPSKTMVIKSPYKGVVTSKHANEGMLVTPGMLVYRLADLSKVWVLVTLYEYQLPYVSVGQQAVMSLPYIPGQTFEGKVIYIYPYLEKTTREVQVRLEFDNPNLLLKPGMFARVELRSTLAEDRVLAPRAAVIDTGERQVAFVSLGGGRFEPREVRMGIETGGGKVEILDGLRPGELVVTSAQFLLDSEAKVREALAKMIKGDLASEQQAPAEGESELESLPPAVAGALGEALDAYLAIGDRFAADTAAGIAAPARRIASSVDAMLEMKIEEDPHFWHRHTEVATVRGKALELVDPGGIEEARLKYADLSVALSKLLKATGVPAGYGKGIEEIHCPMFREGQGGSSWLQSRGDVRNPFFGSTMLRCFDRRVALPVTPAGPEAEAGGPGAPTAEPPPPAEDAAPPREAPETGGAREHGAGGGSPPAQPREAEGDHEHGTAAPGDHPGPHAAHPAPARS